MNTPPPNLDPSQPRPPKPRRLDQARRDLRRIAQDGVFFGCMVGLGETYVSAFALALGAGPVATGFLATAPLLAGACLTAFRQDEALAAYERAITLEERPDALTAAGELYHSSVERVIVPDSFLALDHMLSRFTGIVRGMSVDTARMRLNLDSTGGLVFSGQLLLELTARGMRREDAYRVVQGHAMQAWKSGGDFRASVSRDPEVRGVLGEAEIAEVFRLERYLVQVDAIFGRVYGAGAAAR